MKYLGIGAAQLLGADKWMMVISEIKVLMTFDLPEISELLNISQKFYLFEIL